MSGQHMDDVYNGLPKQFIASLKILFDILDEEHTGSIRLRDIESRWSDEGVRDLPTGVMEGLRKVTPPSGLLTFEGFVAGLKMALIQGKEQGKRRSVSGNNNYIIQKENRIPPGNIPFSSRPADRIPIVTAGSSTNYPLHGDLGNRQQDSHNSSDQHKQGTASSLRSTTLYSTSVKQQIDSNSNNNTRPATAAVKPQPHNSANSYRRSNNPPSSNIYETTTGHAYHAQQLRPPPRPARSFNPGIRKSASGSDLNPPQVPPRDASKNRQILSELKSWQQDWDDAQQRAVRAGIRERPHLKGDNGGNSVHDISSHAIYANIEQFQRKPTEDRAQGQSQSPGKASVRRHGSGRRHTLQNGVDHNMIKRMQQLEEEATMLKTGLEMVDVARDWYLRQITAVQEKQKLLGKVNYNDNSLEAHQERMNFQKARIAEVNMQLRTLVESSEKGFPLHMNLAVTSTLSPHSSDATIKMLKEQNRRLTQEVRERSDKIAKLDQEKASLIRELFEARTKHKSSYDDTTFM